MSSTVWQALQSCLEPHGSPWEPKPGDGLYVHPLSKRSLSARSLALCTENLGCETGSHDFSSSDDDDNEEDREEMNKRSLSLSPRARSAPRPSRTWSFNSRRISASNDTGRNFPPPLTSISGEDCILMNSRRQGGRLVLKAVKIPSPHTYLQAERSDGRLTLRFIRHPSFHSKPRQEVEVEGNVAEIEVEDNVVEGPVESDVVQKPVERNIVEAGKEEEVEEANPKDKEEEEEEDADINGLHLGSDDEKTTILAENSGGCDVSVIEKFKRPSRCKEGGHGNKRFPWEPLWVATS
ncbi:protein FANTASTIC FOUR 1-like [Aristolochia californica]|uniref:protein FANTASTIC FOUR 1-like n=1 Tax=Aristolochia californica TaxID=171875 RepID=UPI0035DCF6A1